MSIDFENKLIELFEQLDKSNFRINLKKHFLFVCGGIIDITAPIPPSFRNRFLTYTADKNDELHNSIVLAETFKDYFKENAYPDLLVFEDDIANISSLVIIFLESPGSLVELGMFCNKPSFFKKLLVVAPEKELMKEDSFIYLGPLVNIKKKDPTSVAIYPWPDKSDDKYNNEHLIDLIETIEKKITTIPQLITFSADNSGHIAYLIYEIIRISFPVLISEIDFILQSLDLDVTGSQISRYIYLLNKLELINNYKYSGYTYYYPIKENNSIVSFGNNQVYDEYKFRFSITQTFITSASTQGRKRKNAMKEIKKIIDKN